MMTCSLLIAVLGITVLVAFAQVHATREMKQLRARVHRVAEWLRERARSEAQLEDLRQLQRVTEATVARGAAVVQAVHRGVAAIPFGILEEIPVTRDTSRLVRDVHDRISGLVYAAIAGGNRALGSAVRQKLESEGDASNGPAPEQKKSGKKK